MSLMQDNFDNYLLEILNLPLIHRCHELGLLIDRSSAKELQDSFLTIVNSIFGIPGGTGWGFRTITRQTNPQEFDVIYHFFVPMGPMFRMCYRLLNESIKFEVPMELLPSKVIHMLHSGRYAQFYTDMIQIDPCRRQIVSLSLNAFDYYILNFVLHGMLALHKVYPAAWAVHNENSKTVYFFLVADYLCSFLPSDPNTTVLPTNICSSMKIATSMPIQPITPSRSPKYLLSSALSHNYSTVNSSNIRPDESSRTFSWRSESVLYFFIDAWLRYDVDESRDLPSSEFIRVVRILIKQLHAFGNAADLDNTSMASLRKMAQPMMNAQMYSFLKSIIARWPLDSSFSVVLELWLSYIQPWRYTFDRAVFPRTELQIQRKHEMFIVENMVSYTQILVQLLPRFERLDFSSLKNVLMMYRIFKVFGQPDLAEILQHNETLVTVNRGLIPSPAHKSFSSDKNQSAGSYNGSFNRSGSAGLMPNTNCSPAEVHNWQSFRADTNINQDTYISLFGIKVQEQLRNLINKIIAARELEKERANYLKTDIRQKHKGFVKYLKWLVSCDDDTLQVQLLNDCQKMPDILDSIMQTISAIFQIPLPDEELINQKTPQYSFDEYQSFDNSFANISAGSLMNPSPSEMKKRARDIQYTGDPALLPIRNNEFTFLVRFLHQVSCKLNLMFASEIRDLWARNDLWGRLSRQILLPPITIKTFDKSTGISVMYEEPLGPRISLRFVGSYKTFLTIITSFVLGQIIFKVPSFGFLMLLCTSFLYIFTLSLFNDPRQTN